MKNKSLFIVFEGIDGSGKTTQLNMALKYLRSRGVPCVGLREPTDGPHGTEIRDILRGEVTAGPEEQLNLFMLDRADDYEKNICPALEKGQTIVMDRYLHSNAAYQGALGIDPVRIISENRNKGFPYPDRVYFIDLPPEIAVKRISGRNPDGAVELFEKKAFLQKVRDIYLEIADETFLIIDGSAPPEEIHRIVISDLELITCATGVV